MTDLIFHIGLAKCGSSTLQRDIFSHEDGYLGTAPGIGPEKNLAKQLQHCTPFAGRQTINRRGLGDWAARVRKLQSQRWPNSDRLIASNEFLSAASRLNDRPILKVLSILKNHFWLEGQIKVVLVLRNQATRLASGYAQNSGIRWNAGQEDFERVVQKAMNDRRRRRLLDYSRWVDGLESVVGPRNICVLLLEESRTAGFWQKLTDFCDLERLDPAEMVSTGSSKNVRSKSPASWTISELDLANRAKVTVDKWMNLGWPAQITPDTRKQFRQQAIERLETRYRSKAPMQSPANREKEIHLNPRVMQMIRERCGPYNDQLARKLGRDLEPLGY